MNIIQYSYSKKKEAPTTLKTLERDRQSYHKDALKRTSHHQPRPSTGFGRIEKVQDKAEYCLTPQKWISSSSVDSQETLKGRDITGIVLAINLGQKNLTHCPDLADQLWLKHLDLQNNVIQTIENMDSLGNLVFLDLYNNQIPYITGLQDLHSLKTLLLGRNKLTMIEGLVTLKKLDTLDLHSNRIDTIENFRSLSNLRILNLEDNLIREIPTLEGLNSLTELNVRRNKIWAIHENSHLKRLSRIILTDNKIHQIGDVEAIFGLEALSELWMDSNKITNQINYKTLIVSRCNALKQLDGRRVVEEIKRTAMKLAKREDIKKRDLEKKQEYLNEKDIYLDQIRDNWNGVKPSANSVHNGKTAYVELDGTCLRVFGDGLAALNRTESNQATNIQFDFVKAGLILQYCDALSRFKNLTRLKFNTTGFSRLKEVYQICLLSLFHFLSSSISHLWTLITAILLLPFLFLDHSQSIYYPS